MIFPHHVYTWEEAVSSEDVERQINVRLNRLSLDILLPGPTEINQLKLKISKDGKSLKILYFLPKIFLASKRTAARVGEMAGVPQGQIANAVGRLGAMHRVQAHEKQLIPIRKQFKEGIPMDIQLPFEVDRQFCKRDDFGVFNHNIEAVSIGIYDHESPTMVNNQQHVWILHVEMTSAHREETDMGSPTGFKMFTGI